MADNPVTSLAVEVVKESGSLIKLLYQDSLQPSIQSIGKAIGNAIQFVVGSAEHLEYYNKQRRLVLEENLRRFQMRLEKEKADNITVAPQEVSVPILEKLAYVTNEELRNRYVELLAKASTIDKQKFAHPAFLRILDGISPDECYLIEDLGMCSEMNNIPTISLAFNTSVGIADALKYQNLLPIEPNVNMRFMDNIDLYLDNLSSLGLIRIYSKNRLVEDSSYTPLLEKYNHILDTANVFNDGFEEAKPFFRKTLISITELGGQFLNSISLSRFPAP